MATLGKSDQKMSRRSLMSGSSCSPPLSLGMTVTLLAAAAEEDEAAVEDDPAGDWRSYAESHDIEPGAQRLPNVAPLATAA